MPIIFVLDHSASPGSGLQKRLREEGYNTLSVRDVGEALETLQCVRADLLVVDVGAARADAERLLKSLRNDPTYKRMPIVFIGAGPEECQHLKPTVGPGSILLRHQTLDDVVLNVRAYVAPRLAVPYN
jgi:DNA-binding response OmpR family regulator